MDLLAVEFEPERSDSPRDGFDGSIFDRTRGLFDVFSRQCERYARLDSGGKARGAPDAGVLLERRGTVGNGYCLEAGR